MLPWETKRSKNGNRVKNGNNGLEFAQNEKARRSKQTEKIHFPD